MIEQYKEFEDGDSLLFIGKKRAKPWKLPGPSMMLEPAKKSEIQGPGILLEPAKKLERHGPSETLEPVSQ